MTRCIPVPTGRRWIAVGTAAAMLTVVPAGELRAADEFSTKEKLLIILLFSGEVGGISAVMNAKRARPPQAEVDISPRDLNFGRVPPADPVMNFVTLANPSTATLRITELRIEPAQFEAVDAPPLPFEINPGADWKLRVRYMPQAGKKASGSVQVRGLFAQSGKAWRGRARLRGEAQ